MQLGPPRTSTENNGGRGRTWGLLNGRRQLPKEHGQRQTGRRRREPMPCRVMSVLIVGGSGFPGSELVRQAAATGNVTAATFSRPGPARLRAPPDTPWTGGDTALVLAMTCASAWMESALTDPHSGRRWIVYDEAWRLMRHVGLLQRMQAQWKPSRGLGIANLMVIHRLSDLLTAGDAGSQGRALAEGLLADCSTRIIYRSKWTPSPTSTAAVARGRSRGDHSSTNPLSTRTSWPSSTPTSACTDSRPPRRLFAAAPVLSHGPSSQPSEGRGARRCARSFSSSSSTNVSIG